MISQDDPRLQNHTFEQIQNALNSEISEASAQGQRIHLFTDGQSQSRTRNISLETITQNVEETSKTAAELARLKNENSRLTSYNEYLSAPKQGLALAVESYPLDKCNLELAATKAFLEFTRSYTKKTRDDYDTAAKAYSDFLDTYIKKFSEKFK